MTSRTPRARSCSSVSPEPAASSIIVPSVISMPRHGGASPLASPVPGVAPPRANRQNPRRGRAFYSSGSDWRRSSTGAKRSPCASMRSSTASESNSSRARAQRVHAHRRLVLVILAPVHEHLPGAQVLAHARDDELGMAALEELRDGERERLGLLVARLGVEREVDLEALRAGCLRPSLEP